MIKKIIVKLVKFFLLEANSFYDYVTYKKYYTKEKASKKGKAGLAAWILQDKHRIEKAFTLPSPRMGFGKDVIPRLVNNLLEYENKYGKDTEYYIGIGALKAYKEFHQLKNEVTPEFYNLNIAKLKLEDFEQPQCDLAGFYKPTEKHSKAELHFFDTFAHSRHSCRNFDKRKMISEDLIEQVMNISITAPSVCNRQHWRVHFFSGEKKNEILKLQNGNSGFTDNIPMVAVITSDLRAFYLANERNQAFTDGGIFAMNMMYAIHSTGMESCALNWSNPFTKDIQIHKQGYIPNNERVILVLAFGFPYDESLYAKSPRLSVDNFYKIHS